MFYIPVTTFENGQYIVQGLFNLISPPAIRAPHARQLQNGTTLTHPETGEFRFSMCDCEYPVHPLANEHFLDPVVQPFIDAGHVAPEVLTALQDAIIQAKVTGSINIWDYLPQFWKDQAIDHETATAEGWFGVQE